MKQYAIQWWLSLLLLWFVHFSQFFNVSAQNKARKKIFGTGEKGNLQKREKIIDIKNLKPICNRKGIYFWERTNSKLSYNKKPHS